MAEGDTVRTVVKFLSHELSKEREEAVSLLYELSKSATLCEKIGSINGAILILVGMTSSKSEDLLTVEKADKTLENLEKCESNVRQMAENGRLQPLLTQLLEGTKTLIYISYHVTMTLKHDIWMNDESVQFHITNKNKMFCCDFFLSLHSQSRPG